MNIGLWFYSYNIPLISQSKEETTIIRYRISFRLFLAICFLPCKIKCKLQKVNVDKKFCRSFAHQYLIKLCGFLLMRPIFKLLNVSITFDLITLHVDRKNFGNIDFPPDVAPYCFWYLSTKIPLLYIL